MSTPDVVIVGGGIGGLSTAFALSRLGLQVRVLEQAKQFGEVGAGIQLAPNCTRSLIAADGLHSVARTLFTDDRPVSSAYVAYRGTVPIAEMDRPVDLTEVVVYVGPRCHFVHYGLRGGDLLNQVAVFESPQAVAGLDDWGTPDELDTAFAATCDFVQDRLPRLWRDKWWRIYDRDPIDTWVDGRIALLGAAAHPPLQYMVQGAIMAIEDGWVLAQHVRRLRGDDGVVDWRGALAAYEAVRPEHCRRVVLTARVRGELWHLDGPPMFAPIPLDSADRVAAGRA